jgi:TRAP-type mannitol/chloroaromatic compound transport system permease large subunit
MTLLVVLLVLAVVFGAGAVLEGLAWAVLIALVLVAAAAWLGWKRVRNASRST